MFWCTVLKLAISAFQVVGSVQDLLRPVSGGQIDIRLNQIICLSKGFVLWCVGSRRHLTKTELEYHGLPSGFGEKKCWSIIFSLVRALRAMIISLKGCREAETFRQRSAAFQLRNKTHIANPSNRSQSLSNQRAFDAVDNFRSIDARDGSDGDRKYPLRKTKCHPASA